MSQTITCPACGASDLDVCCYDSMMVVRADLAMFTLRCPSCGAKVLQHADHTLPAARRGAVRRHRGGRGHGPRVTSRAGCAAGRARTRRVLPPTSQLRRSARQRNPMLNDIYWNLDPVLFSAGPFTVRWYGIAYVAGFVCAALLIWRLAKRWRIRVDADALLTIMFCVIIGVVAGGRLGYVLFYGNGLEFYLQNPLEVLAFNHGGMSFHGGLVGALLAGIAAAKMTGIPYLTLADLGCVAAPIGLFFGRLANFVNGELWGGPTDLPWGVVFGGAAGHHAAPSLPALRGAAGGRAHLRRAVHALAQAPAAPARHVPGRVPDYVRLLSVRHRIRAPARCAARISVGRLADHGPAPVRPARARGNRRARLCASDEEAATGSSRNCHKASNI